MARWGGLFLLLLALGACRDRGGGRDGLDQQVLAARESRLEARRAGADSADAGAPLARWVLPGSLNEISGLTINGAGNLVAHDDEDGTISELDYRTGVLLRQYRLGNVTADFEGIANTGDFLYLLVSNGELYQFRESAGTADVPYTIQDTRLGKECEFEGLGYEERANRLLLACKNVGVKELKDQLVIFRWSLREDAGDRLDRITVPMDQVAGPLNEKELHPSGIEVDPLTGNYVLLSSQERALVIITPDGKLVSSRHLPDTHDQAEGIAITPDSLLIISDEAVKQPATITVYRWP